MKTLKALEDMGASFHPSLQIVESEGNISTLCDNDSTSDEIFMDVPLKCMPILADYRYELQGDKLEVTLKKSAVNPSAAHIMKLTVDLFNETNKLKTWRDTYPIFQLAGHKELVYEIFKAKGPAEKYAELYAESPEDVPDSVLINSFMGSRRFSFSAENMQKVGVKLRQPKETGLIPIIELINHKMGAHPFQVDEKKSFIEDANQTRKKGERSFCSIQP